MAGECGGRSESRCMTPFLLKPITCAKNLKPFVQLPNVRPMQDCTGLTSDQI